MTLTIFGVISKLISISPLIKNKSSSRSGVLNVANFVLLSTLHSLVAVLMPILCKMQDYSMIKACSTSFVGPNIAPTNWQFFIFVFKEMVFFSYLDTKAMIFGYRGISLFIISFPEDWDTSLMLWLYMMESMNLRELGLHFLDTTNKFYDPSMSETAKIK